MVNFQRKTESKVAAMIGRANETGVIVNHVDAMCALKHTRNVVFVTGEAGIGKTTMLESIREMLAKRTGLVAPVVVATECSTPLLGQDVGQVEALEPWAELLEKIVEHDGAPAQKKEMAKLMGHLALAWIHVVPVVGGILESSLETAAIFKEHLGHDGEKTHAASQEQMFQQYINFLAKASEAHPLVLFLDDFHWADTSSTNLLFSAARHLSNKRVLFVVAYRADDAASSRDGKGHPILHVRNELGRYSLFTDVVVPKMTPVDLDGVLRERYPRYQNNAEFERWLAERSGGNALFITQYLSTLEEDGIVDDQTGKFNARFDSVRVPTSAFSVVEERIRRLDDDSRELLRYASVEGATFTAQVLAALADTAKLRLLQKVRLIAEKHGVVKSLGKQRIYANESTAFQFTNTLMQRALYDSLEEEERDELHARIFRSIKDDFASAEDTDASVVGLAVRLAAHASSPDDRLFAAKLLLEAATVSWSRFAEEETLGVLSTLATQVEALDAARLMYGKPDASTVRRLDADARVVTGLVHKFRGRHAEALEHFRAGRAMLEKLPGGEARALWVMGREAFTLENARRYEEAETLTHEVLARAAELKDERTRGAMLNNLGLVLTAMGRAREGMDVQRQSLQVREAIDDRRGQAVTLGSMGLALFSVGKFEDALEWHRRSLQFREQLGDRVGQGYSLANIGNALVALGRLEEALTYYEKSVDVRESTGAIIGLLSSLDSEAKLLLQLDRRAEAIECLARALRLRETLGNRTEEAKALAQLGTLWREHGDETQSRDLLERAQSIALEIGEQTVAKQAEVELAKLPPAPEAPPPDVIAPPATTNGHDVHAEAPETHGLPHIVRVIDWIDKKLELRAAARKTAPKETEPS